MNDLYNVFKMPKQTRLLPNVCAILSDIMKYTFLITF